jgi:hypothetical protein
MSNIVSIWDFEFVKGKKINKKSPLVIEAIRRLKKERKFTTEEYEDVIELPELILKMHDLANEIDNKRGNNNASK